MRLPNPYSDESRMVARLLGALNNKLDWSAAAQKAAPWVQSVRDNPPPFWAMESLLKEYPISSAEGLALMRLAEALLRVPDVETAIALTADQLGRADFEGTADKVLARLGNTAIAMSKHLLPDEQGQRAGLMGKLGAKTVVAATFRAVQLLGRQFVLGQTMQEAMNEANAARKKARIRYSYDMLGEGARTDADALRYLQSYGNAIDFIAKHAAGNTSLADNDGISIKLSALHPRYEDAKRERLMQELLPRVWSLCERAAIANINLTIDAEEVDRLELSLDIFEALLAKVAVEYPNWQGFGLAMQTYQTRSLALIEHIIQLARKHRVRLMCRLVKGAYWDAEIKRTQEMGLPHYPVFTHKHHTDISYLACAAALLEAPDAVYPQFATHNAATIAALLQMAAKIVRTDAFAKGNGSEMPSTQFELQRLHGMGEGIYREVMKNPLIACRVYAPVGAHRDLLAYLVRRLLENGANSSFVHQLADESIKLQELLISPLRLESQSSLPLPPVLFGSHAGARKNSVGFDLTVETMRAPFMAAITDTPVPEVRESLSHEIENAYAQCAKGFHAWSRLHVHDRSFVLKRAADTMQDRMPELCAILVKEAHKTLADAISEVREAVDFLRYYADEAVRIMNPISCPQDMTAPPGSMRGVTGESNILRLTARGVWVCISPWNFPLAIFTGQVAAALATGNTVLAKPAEQTPAIAELAVQILHLAGVPEDALQLLNGSGEAVGAALVNQAGIAGVVFTGSTQVAKIIQRTLAAKDGPIVSLIAETGGINAMLVDSSALPEQVVDSVIQSSFRSAGQRCSALRLLCVHEAIADGLIEMLKGAVDELSVGDPAFLSTDVGPLIDNEAHSKICSQIARLKASSRVIETSCKMEKTAATLQSNLLVPQVFEVAAIADVGEEIFGPVLQIVRWSGDPASVIEQINSLGYGLTLGIQTRIDGRARELAELAHIGNVYINRNMIGAVVGVQPFGGEGMSGTGPKAGGPHYLYRFCAEQTVTINTTAAGGNATLLAAMH